MHNEGFDPVEMMSLDMVYTVSFGVMHMDSTSFRSLDITPTST